MKLKKYLLPFFILLSLPVFSQTGTTTTVTISSAGLTAGSTVDREYRKYVPSSYDGSTPYSLIFNFHGTGSNAQQEQWMCGFDVIADTAKIIMIYPEGLVQPNSGDKTAWNSLGTVQENKDTDLKFVEDMLADLIANYNINSCKVYATGMSIGGYMTYDIGCFLNSKFAAIASVTGIMLSSHLNACNPTHPTPVMDIHGDNDNVVAYTPGFGQSGSIDLVNYWVGYNNCTTPGTMTAVPDVTTADNCTAENYLYPNGDMGTTVEHYKILNGGHTWPALGSTTSGKNGDFNASLAIWKFFRPHCLDDLNGTPPCTPPTATISGDATVCPGTSATISIALTGTGPWTVTKAINGVDQTPVSPPTSPYTFLSTDIGVYTVSAVTDNGSCPGTSSGSATVTENTDITISNLTETCIPGNNDYTVEFDVAGGDTLTYEFTDGTGSFTTPTHFVSDPIASATSYTFTINDQYSCGTPASVSGIKDCSGPSCSATATISGDNTICAGGSATVSIDLTGTSPWTITYAIDGAVQTSVTESSATYTFAATAAGVYTVTSIADGTCTGTSSGSATITENTPITTTALTETCNPSNADYVVEFDIAGGDQATYVNTGDAGTFTGNHFISDPIASGTAYTFSINDGLACAAATEVTGIKNCATTPGCDPPTITSAPSDVEMCDGGPPATLTVNADGTNISYQWSTGDAGPTTTVIPPVTTTYTCVVTEACGAETSVTVTVFIHAQLSTRNLTETCNAGNTDYVVEFELADPSSSYSYSGSEGTLTPPSSGSGGNPLYQFTSNPIPSGTSYSFSIDDNTCFTSTAISGTKDCGGGTPPPSCTANISGGGTVCPTNTTTTDVTITATGTGPWMVTYAIDGVDQQTVPLQTSPTIITVATAGVYTLSTVVDASSCNATTTGIVSVTEDCGTPPPTTCNAITTSGLTEICNGTTYSVDFDIAGGDQASGYTVNGGTGTVSNNHFTSAAIPSGSSYAFTIDDANSCSSPINLSGSKTCNTGPCTATATISGGGITCEGSKVEVTINLTGNPPWNFTIDPGGISVTNQNTSPYVTTVSVTGNYTVTSISDDGCTGTSSGNALVESCNNAPEPGTGTVTGIEENVSIQEVRIYPNPSNGSFNIDMANANFESLQITIVNLLGSEIYKELVSGGSPDFSKQIDLMNVPSGLYYIKLSTETEMITKKIIIQ